MFGLSLSKIIFTIVIILAVLWVYRQLSRLTDGRQKSASENRESTYGRDSASPVEQTEDLSACAVCGVYVAAGSNPDCGRVARDCPMQ